MGEYAGAFGIALSHTDCKLMFLSVDPVISEDGTIIGERKEQLSNITLSLPLAKQLSKRLSNLIHDYEMNETPIFDLDLLSEGDNTNKEA